MNPRYGLNNWFYPFYRSWKITIIQTRVFGGIWKYEMQTQVCLQTCTICAAGFQDFKHVSSTYLIARLVFLWPRLKQAVPLSLSFLYNKSSLSAAVLFFLRDPLILFVVSMVNEWKIIFFLDTSFLFLAKMLMIRIFDGILDLKKEMHP